MKIIKIKEDYYVVVDDSEIKEGNWYLIGRTIYHCLKNIPKDLHNENKIFKITHSTQPLGVKPITDKVVIQENKAGKPLISAQYVELDMSSTVKLLSLQEVKELIGEVDVEKKEIILTDSQKELLKMGSVFYKDSSVIYYLPYIIINENNKWYIQLEDNKEKKYTEEDLRKAIQLAWEADSIDGTVDLNIVLHYGDNNDLRTKWSEDEIIKSFQPKTEWEVEIVDDKLKLK